MKRVLKYWLILCLCLYGKLGAQTISDTILVDETAASTRFIHNPGTLVNVLTKDKTNDLDKFNAIFKWVVTNIDYDYQAYFSSGGVTKPDIERLLRNRKGVCLHYAALMDTLCSLAGITNVSIYGYAKDELFDVNDSIYIDNHAWNAVKLDGKWQLYDITAASGRPYYRYTKRSLLILKLLRRYTIQYKKVQIKQRRLTYRNSNCQDAGENVETVPAYRWKMRIRHKLLRRILKSFELKIVRDYKKEFNPDFYLVQPEVFAITHFPDNPNWSLVSGRKIRTFETDSSFYHLQPQVYKTQVRGGRTCMDCDNELSFDALAKNYYFRKQSLAFNNRNRFIVTLCEYNIAGIKLEEGKKAEDSLTKVTLFDTSLAFLDHARANILQSYLNVLTDYDLQNAKNHAKINMLRADNQRHINFVKDQIHTGFQETRNIRDLENKLNVFGYKVYRRKGLLYDYTSGNDVKQDAKQVDNTIHLLTTRQADLNERIDTLNKEIIRSKTRFNNTLPLIADLLWKKVLSHDSMLQPIIKSANFRSQQKDSYKKEIVDLCREITLREKNYLKDVDSSLYKPAAAICLLGDKIMQMIDARNVMDLELFKVKRQLVNFKTLSRADLDNFKEALIIENKDDLCWLQGRGGHLRSVFYGFKALTGKQSQIVAQFGAELSLETYRFRLTNAELNRRSKKYKAILRANRRVVNYKAKEVRAVKRAYLKTLREALLEARKNK